MYPVSLLNIEFLFIYLSIYELTTDKMDFEPGSYLFAVHTG